MKIKSLITGGGRLNDAILYSGNGVVEHNSVAGIEIENSRHAIVDDNYVMRLAVAQYMLALDK